MTKEESFERTLRFEDELKSLLKAEAMSMAIDALLGHEDLDAIDAIPQEKAEEICQRFVTRLGMDGASRLTLLMLKYMLGKQQIAFDPDAPSIFGFEGEVEIKLSDYIDDI